MAQQNVNGAASEEKAVSLKASSITETRSEIENVKANSQALKGVPAEKQAIYLEFAAKDNEWLAYHNKMLLRKVDGRLLPCLILMYLLNFLDRSNLAQARLGTLEEDLGMKGTDFNLATSILFVVSKFQTAVMSQY